MTFYIQTHDLNALSLQELRRLLATLKSELDSGIRDPDEQAALRTAIAKITAAIRRCQMRRRTPGL